MNADEINAAIAESVGYYQGTWTRDERGRPMVPVQRWFHDSIGPEYLRGNPIAIPNYHGSLDAIVPVVRAMDDESMAQVALQLHRIAMARPLFSCYVATAAQWCEAYLKSLNLWK